MCGRRKARVQVTKLSCRECLRLLDSLSLLLVFEWWLRLCAAGQAGPIYGDQHTSAVALAQRAPRRSLTHAVAFVCFTLPLKTLRRHTRQPAAIKFYGGQHLQLRERIVGLCNCMQLHARYVRAHVSYTT